LGGEYIVAGGYGATSVSCSNSTANGFGALCVNSIGSNSSGYGASIYGSTASNNDATFSMLQASIYSSMSSTATFSYMVNASNTNIYGPRSVVLGGDDHTITNAYDMILGGQRNTISGMFSYAMGSDMTVSSPNSFGINLSPYYSPTAYTLAQTSTMAIMGGQVGIGTTTPTSRLTIHDDNNWLNLSNGTYGIDFTWETSTIDYPLISGKASSTEIFGADLEGVGVKNALLLVSDVTPAIVFSAYTNILSTLAQISFEVADSFMNFNGAKKYSWFDYDTGETEVFKIDAENVEVAIPSIASCSALGTDADGVITCMDMASMGGSMEEQIKATIKGMSFWEKLLLMF
jgi:hypothetical protein